jgi:hypothetical protein
MSNTANKKSGKNKNKNKNASDTTAEAKDDKVVDTNLENTSNEKPDDETNGDATGDDKPDTNTETKAESEAPAPAEAKKGKEKAPKKEREKKAPKEKVDAHLAKVEAYGKGLPTPSAAVVELLELARALSTGDMNVLATHIAFDARKRATIIASSNAKACPIKEGDRVKIIAASGNPRFIGQVGTVTRANRIRIFVQLATVKHPVYLFSSEVEHYNDGVTELDITDESDEDKAANG